jgi:very-short-patch-repair endonuclease
VVGFVTLDGKLIVEVDGVTHSEPSEVKRDEARSRVLESCGFLVVRISNTDVYENLEGVLEMIETSLRFD